MLAALELFSQKGYSATGVDEIAEYVGLKGPNLYKYFKNKEALFYELAEFSVGQYRRHMSLDKDSEISIHSAAELKEFSMKQLEFTLTNEYIRKLRRLFTIEQFRNKELSKMVTIHQYSNIMGIYTKTMKVLIDDGLIDKDNDPVMLAKMYMSPVSMLIQICDREYERKDELLKQMEEYIDFFISKFVKG